MDGKIPGPYQELLEQFTQYKDVGFDRIGIKRARMLLDESLACIRGIPEKEKEYQELYIALGEGIGLDRMNLHHQVNFARTAYTLAIYYRGRSRMSGIDTNGILAEHYTSHCLSAYQTLEKKKYLETLKANDLKRIKITARIWESLRPQDRTHTELAIKADILLKLDKSERKY